MVKSPKIPPNHPHEGPEPSKPGPVKRLQIIIRTRPRRKKMYETWALILKLVAALIALFKALR